MIDGCKRFVGRHPTFVILLIGLWFVVAPVAFGSYFRNLSARNDSLSGPEGLLEQFVFSHHDHAARVSMTMLIIGMGLIGLAIWRIVRPRISKR
jgi:lysylphosphatidylglycerol synthetase-like protein (DUF2156 family)